MAEIGSRQIVIAGAGIAGLTAALAFAARGHTVRIFERAPRLEAVGAGIQLSPNATRILDGLGVLSALLPAAVRPDAVVIRDAKSLAELARVPLGDAAERRWKAPYLAVHRSDLQSALLARIAREPDIQLATGAEVRDAALHAHGVTVSVEAATGLQLVAGRLLVGADGVWSSVRGLGGEIRRSRFAGQLAWRRTVRAESPEARALVDLGAASRVTAFLAPGFHMVAYPVRGGGAFNLAAFTAGSVMAETWSERTDPLVLRAAMGRTAPALARLADDGWTAWPIHTVDAARPWIAADGIALIGDAAHAMTPFAAQGAAMAIEDAETLAAFVSARPQDLAGALAAWEKSRRPRIDRVARRGALNRFAWHASGPVAMARNFFLRMRSPEKLAADLDWLYGWDFQHNGASRESVGSG
jgi:salicylate hydroxylase